MNCVILRRFTCRWKGHEIRNSNLQNCTEIALNMKLLLMQLIDVSKALRRKLDKFGCSTLGCRVSDVSLMSRWSITAAVWHRSSVTELLCNAEYCLAPINQPIVLLSDVINCPSYYCVPRCMTCICGLQRDDKMTNDQCYSQFTQSITARPFLLACIDLNQ